MLGEYMYHINGHKLTRMKTRTSVSRVTSFPTPAFDPTALRSQCKSPWRLRLMSDYCLMSCSSFCSFLECFIRGMQQFSLFCWMIFCLAKISLLKSSYWHSRTLIFAFLNGFGWIKWTLVYIISCGDKNWLETSQWTQRWLREKSELNEGQLALKIKNKEWILDSNKKLMMEISAKLEVIIFYVAKLFLDLTWWVTLEPWPKSTITTNQK